MWPPVAPSLDKLVLEPYRGPCPLELGLQASSQPPEKSPESVTQSGLKSQSPQREAVKGSETCLKLMRGNPRGQGMIHGEQTCQRLSLPAVRLGSLVPDQIGLLKKQ